MTRAATRAPRTWGVCVGFESCPKLLDGLVEGFTGPWTPLEAVADGVTGVCTGLESAGLGEPPEGADQPFACVVVAARTMADLRRAVPMRDLVPAATRVRVAIAEVPPWAAQPLPVAGQSAAWRHLVDLRITRKALGWHVDALFAESVAGGEVLAHLAHGLVGPRRHLAQPVIGLAGTEASHWRPGDPNVTLSAAGGPVPDRRDAPGCDLVLRVAGHGIPPWNGGTIPLVERCPEGPATHPDLLPPVDEAVVNPIGFRQHPPGALATLAEHGHGFAVTLGPETLVRLPPGGDLTDVEVARLRDVRGVVVRAISGRPLVAARIVAALAAAGVPVIAEADAARDAALGAELADAVAAVDADELASDLRREELSIRLRRCALRTHGAVARWRSIVSSAGLPMLPEPAVSILLCTRRPEMIPFALQQMERQRGVTAELIVGLHGLSARETETRSAHLPVTVVEAPSGVPFGEVLNRMAVAASGSFLAKVDDDDWYGPDHLADLLLAQLYSGAELVGSAAEFVYLEPINVTIRRRIGTERFVPLVAGGTMLISRAMFEAVGGFRPLPRTVDGQLLHAVHAAGGRIYRTHGFNYVLRRRNAQGHTWRQPVQSFLESYQDQWRGLVFNELMDNTVPYGGQR